MKEKITRDLQIRIHTYESHTSTKKEKKIQITYKKDRQGRLRGSAHGLHPQNEEKTSLLMGLQGYIYV